MKKLNKDNKGFSLVELLVVIAIMVVLVGVIAPTLLSNIEKSRVAADIQSLDAVAGAVQDALADESAYTAAMLTSNGYAGAKSINDILSGTDDLAKKVQEYLASAPGLKGTNATGKTIYVSISDKARVTVWVDNATPKAAPTSGTASNIVKAKDDKTYYYVQR